MPNKKDGSVVIYKVGTDNIITEATNSLSGLLILSLFAEKWLLVIVVIVC
jgi:hypothetical protein